MFGWQPLDGSHLEIDSLAYRRLLIGIFAMEGIDDSASKVSSTITIDADFEVIEVSLASDTDTSEDEYRSSRYGDKRKREGRNKKMMVETSNKKRRREEQKDDGSEQEDDGSDQEDDGSEQQDAGSEQEDGSEQEHERRMQSTQPENTADSPACSTRSLEVAVDSAADEVDAASSWTTWSPASFESSSRNDEETFWNWASSYADVEEEDEGRELTSGEIEEWFELLNRDDTDEEGWGGLWSP